ncbi:MAG: FkbM family methyltransferase [Archaeoglobaceae archaeon]
MNYELVKKSFITVINKLYNTQKLTLPNGLILFCLPDGFGSIEENLFENVYFSVEELKFAKSIVDLGAHSGAFTVFSILNAKENTKIISLEPNPANFEILLKNIKLVESVATSKNLKLECLKMAVSDKTGLSNLKISFWSESSHLSEDGDVLVPTISIIQDLLLNLESPVVIKMDIEGEECNIFRKNTSWLDQIDLIAIENHGCENEIIQKLKNRGFEVIVDNRKIDKKFAWYWIKTSPKKYTYVISLYRLIVSTLIKPEVSIIKGIRK